MASDRETIRISDLTRLREQESRPSAITPEEVEDYAIAALVVLRGMRRGDKLKVLRRALRVLGAK